MSDGEKTKLKTKMTSWIEIECDLSEYPKDLSDYVLDQFEDRIYQALKTDGIDVEDIEFERDYEKQKLTFSSPVVDLIQKIIEEKQADMNFEKRASQECLEAGLEEADKK